MHFSVRIEMFFYKPGPSHELQGECLASAWRQDGSIQMAHGGKFKDYIPAWVTGQEPVERGQTSEPAAASLS